MAWITKNSGTAQITRRPEPYLTQEMMADIEANLLPRYPTRKAASLPVLHRIQDIAGWLPLQAIEEAAAFLKITPTELLDTASFYEMFFLQPKGKYLIWVCESISCELMGHDDVMHAIEKKLGIEAGQTTTDGKFTLMHAQCLGACGSAPCGMINDKLHENMTAGNVAALLDALP